ncbi:MAG: helix-turn-helix domain-containing protein [Oscillospiraceae bacterium]|nr:helix-turn-helix domain-containing protein [Oscillospiraceae bacterium]
MKLYEKLQMLRREKGLSQEMLAEMLDVSRQAVSKWESGQTYPETDKLIAISNIFDVTLDSLVKDGEPLRRSSEPQHGGCNAVPCGPWRRSYEYKSRQTAFGLPLVHINIGWDAKRAKGVVAIGNMAQGLVAIGLLSAGLVSIGLLSAGLVGIGVLSFGLLLALGSISVGAFAIGAIAIGIFALGAVAIGMFSTGALALASHIAVGDHAYGHIAVGRIAEGVRTFIDTSPGRNFAEIDADQVRTAIGEEFPGMWNWIIRWMTVLFR